MKNTFVTILSPAELQQVNKKAHRLHDRDNKRRRIRKSIVRMLAFFF